MRNEPGAESASCALADGFHVRRWTDLDLDALLVSWTALAREASTPNPFYEAWFLRPSLRHLDPDGTVSLALLIVDDRLVGLMPCGPDNAYHGRRVSHFAPWLHANAFCGAPLIAPGHEENFWRALLGHLDAQPGRALFLHIPQMPQDSAACRALTAVCAGQRRPCRAVHREARALLQHGLTPLAHYEGAMSAKKRKELRRQRTRLADEGSVTVVRQRTADGLTDWIDRFLALEQRGWKGTRNSALASEPRTEALIREALGSAARQGLLERLSLDLDGRPLAMLATFLAPPGSFAFKTAYDEDYARFSPGLLLQIENLALLNDDHIAWCDSCAAADHPMIERIWRDRREIVWYSIAIGGPLRRAIGGTLSAIEERRARSRA